MVVVVNKNRVEKFVGKLQEDTSIKIAYKNESRFMKLLGMLLFFNKAFMTHYITTILDTVYFPNKKQYNRNPAATMITIAHEYAHIKRSNKMTQPPYMLAYLMPQILALAGIPAAFFVGWWALLSLLFLLPIPAYGRMRIEVEGYTMGLFVLYHILREKGLSEKVAGNRLRKRAAEIDEGAFRGPGYYYMWTPGVDKRLDKAIDSIVSGDIIKTNDIYSQVKDALEASKS